MGNPAAIFPARLEWCRGMAQAMRQSGMNLTEPVWPSHFLCSPSNPLPDVLQCLEAKHGALMTYMVAIRAPLPRSAALFRSPLMPSAIPLAGETTPSLPPPSSLFEHPMNAMFTMTIQEHLYGTQPRSSLLWGMYDYLFHDNWFQTASDKLLLAKWRLLCTRATVPYGNRSAPSTAPGTITPHGGRWYAWAVLPSRQP